MALRIIMLGPPSAGKGTQCDLIKSKYRVLHCGTGDVLRKAVREQTPLGRKAQGWMSRGELVPDTIIHDIVCTTLRSRDCVRRGYVLDGFPKNPKQAFFLLAEGFTPNIVLWLRVDSDSTLIHRTVGRRIDQQTGKIYHIRFAPPPEAIASRVIHRPADSTAHVKNRIAYYRRFAPHVRGRFPGLVREINGDRPIAEVFADIEKVLDHVLNPRLPEPVLNVVTAAAIPTSGSGSGSTTPAQAFRPKWSLTGALSKMTSAVSDFVRGAPAPRRKKSTAQRNQSQGGLAAAADLGGLQHLRETMDPDTWQALVESSRSRNALNQLVDRTPGLGPGASKKADEEGEEEGEVEVDASVRALFTPSRQWIPESLFKEECMICMDHPVQGDGIFCPNCKTPVCNECSCNMVLEIVEAMQGDLSEYPPKCRCCRAELTLANFEMVLNHLLQGGRQRTKKEVLVKQYELIMIAAAFQKTEMSEIQISCPFCKCLTLYEDADQVVIVHCQAVDCGRCFCWRCNVEVPLEAWARYCQQGAKAEDIDSVLSHYTRCRSLQHVRTEIEEAIEWGAVNRCPNCHVPGQKDTACTHISHAGCATWCYVCEKTFGSGHNDGWQDNPDKCPMYLHKIHEFDSSWPTDPAQAVLYYHEQKTLRALREVVDRHGILPIALLKRDLPGIFGGFSLGRIMRVGADAPMYVRRGEGYRLPKTPATAALLQGMEGAQGSNPFDLPEPVPAAPSRRVRRRQHRRRRGRGRKKWNPFDSSSAPTQVPDMPEGDIFEIFAAGTLAYPLFNFEAKGGEEMTCREGDVVRVAAVSPDRHWVFVYHLLFGKSGYVPTSYLRPVQDLAVHQQTYVPRNAPAPAAAGVPAPVRKGRIQHATQAAVTRAQRPPSPESYPCVAGWCLVEMAESGQFKQMRDLRKGDLVRTGGSGDCVAAVICVLKTVTTGTAQLVQLTPGLAITAHHPVRIDGVWQQPEKLGKVVTLPCDDLYLYLLSDGHSLFVDGVECVGLAHGFTENEVISHGYFGTKAIVKDLMRMDGWEDGLVVIHADGLSVQRDPISNGVVGIVESEKPEVS